MKSNTGKLKNQTIQFALKVGAIFLTSSLIGTLLGNFLDAQFKIKPFGTLLSLGIFYVLTWILAFKIMNDIQKLIKESKEKENTKDNNG